MLYWAIVFLVSSLAAAVAVAGGVLPTIGGFARILSHVFLILALVVLVIAWFGRSRGPRSRRKPPRSSRQ